MLCISTIFGTASCNDDQVFNQTDTAPLQVSVNAQGTQSSRAIIHGEYLPDGSSIGISLFTRDGNDYDNQGYFNVKYTASGEDADQAWAAQGTTPSISANPANLLAYYPWSDNQDLDLTATPVENASQTDYMYSGLVEGITNANPKVNITMQHALTAIRVNLVLGNFTGDATVSNIAVKSPGLASDATLVIYDGSLDNISGQGSEFAMNADFALSASGTANDVLFVPDAAVTEGTTTVSATIGGKKYTAAISFDEAYLQGYIYTYTLTLNNSGFQVTKVAVDPWKTGADDSAQLEPEKDNAYIVKIVASYEEVMVGSYVEKGNITNNINSQSVKSRSGGTFDFKHNVLGFVGTIDWGDGTTTDTYNEPVDNPTHVYPNDGTEYIITAKGQMSGLYNNGDSFRQCLREIIHIGDCGITSMNYAFAWCNNLTTIPEGLFDNCTAVTSFNETFSRCYALTTIPEGLFDACTEVTSFNGTFEYTGITTIPEGLFKNNTKVTSFYDTFSSTDITSIPTGLFDACTEVTNFYGAFGFCPNLKSIPTGLFDYCTEVTSFSYVFAECDALTSIPSGLFDKCTKVTNFGEAFRECTSLTGESPYTMVNGVKVHLYERNNYPDYFTAPTSYPSCFSQCTGLTDYSSIPSSWL